MLHLRPILSALGLLLCTIAFAMLLPSLVDFADGDPDWLVFFASSVATFFIGGLLILSSQEDRPVQLSVKDGFLLTTACWVFVAAFAAIPFVGVGLKIHGRLFRGDVRADDDWSDRTYQA